jgi:hypothetical protein
MVLFDPAIFDPRIFDVGQIPALPIHKVFSVWKIVSKRGRTGLLPN